MKIVFIYASNFGYKIGNSSAEGNSMESDEGNYQDIQTAFIHVESQDQDSDNYNKLITRFIKQAKWVARKNGTDNILLHSFAHLAATKSEPDFAKQFFDDSQLRLENAGFTVYQTPFGYFLDLDLQAPGRSLARVYYEI